VPQITSFQVEVESQDKSVTLGSLIGEEAAPTRKRKSSRSIDEFIDEKKKER
jgi:hypothetical protein